VVKIRKLMTEKNWDFDRAFGETCRQESAAKTAPTTASVLGRGAPSAEPELMLVRSIDCTREVDFGEDD
jgi:hypothetical protein